MHASQITESAEWGVIVGSRGTQLLFSQGSAVLVFWCGGIRPFDVLLLYDERNIIYASTRSASSIALAAIDVFRKLVAIRNSLSW